VVIRKSENEEALAKIRAQLESGADLTDVDYSSVVRVDELTMDLPPNDPLHDPLTAELSSFLDSVRSGETPVVDAAAGYAAVDAAERVVASLNAHRWEGRAGLQL
jgi:predicted dehydrogenase